MEPKSGDYKIIEAFTGSDLSREVSKLLHDGWELYGDPFTAYTAKSGKFDTVLFCQAVLKK